MTDAVRRSIELLRDDDGGASLNAFFRCYLESKPYDMRIWDVVCDANRKPTRAELIADLKALL